MTAVLIALLKRPIIEIAILAGLLALEIISTGFAVYLVSRGLAYFRIKKIGATGIEFDNRQGRK
jgi:hypothetical protein